MTARLTLLWIAAVLLFAPPLTYALGRLAATLSPMPPPLLLTVCCAAACALITATFGLLLQRLAAELRPYLPTSSQMAVVMLFAVCVSIPRLIAIDPSIPLAVYDDNWHYQKMVSVFGSFPDLTHYLFPDLKLSYYFYSYVIPAATYSMNAGGNLKIIWAGYLFVLILALYTLIMTCGNRLLPESNKCRTLFALIITFAGGLHEWPGLMSAWVRRLPNWHTEWWAQGIGLNLQISSAYTACFWAPQHVCGLALFALVATLLSAAKRSRTVWLACGLLTGIQAGFSAYTALATVLYVMLSLMHPRVGPLRERMRSAGGFAAGFALMLLLILDCFIGRQDSIAFVPSFTQLPGYIFFLFAELGAVLILPILYAVGSRTDPERRARIAVDGMFITAVLIILFCVRSSGFNVISYRMMLPAQLLLAVYAARQLEHMKPKRGVLKQALAVLLLIQLSGFAPEMIAMSKKHYDMRTGALRLPEAIVTMNRTLPLDEVIAVPYMPEINTVMRLNTLVNNLFRPKAIDSRYLCEGTLDTNNLVYLNNAGVNALRIRCEAEEGPETQQ